MSVRVLIRDHPHRTVALTTSDHSLVFRHSQSASDDYQNNLSSSSAPLSISRFNVTPRCMVEFGARNSLELNSFRTVNNAQGTLGLITLNNDVFLCTIILASQVASVRPGETVQRIHSVEFCAHFLFLVTTSMLMAW
jgi:ligand-binding sensor domain-containing protein